MSFNRIPKLLSLVAVVVVVALILAACSSATTTTTSQAGTTKTSPPATTPAATPTATTSPTTPASTVTPLPAKGTASASNVYTFTTGATTDGQIFLVDQQGMTLYYSTKDASGMSHADAATIANWPVFYAAAINVPASINATDFGTITRSDGAPQTTFQGWPLYTYVKDTAPGDINGQGVNDTWFMVQPYRFAPPQRYTLTTGWDNGQPVMLYNLGKTADVAADGTVPAGSLYQLITGTDSSGNPVMVPGQAPIFDLVPGQPIYTGLWKVVDVKVPAGYVANTVTSFEQIVSDGLTLTPTDKLVNCPIVPAGSTTETGTALLQGWYNGQRVYYFNFGANPATPMPVYELITGTDSDGNPQPVTGQDLILNAVPGEAGYSAFCQVHLVTVPAGYQANTLKNAADVISARYSDQTTGELINCPAEAGG